MNRMDIEAIYRNPTPAGNCLRHPTYSYLLRGVTVSWSNHVWAADITYIPMKRGFVYLFAVVDLSSRRVLSWRLSNTLTMVLLHHADSTFAYFGGKSVEFVHGSILSSIGDSSKPGAIHDSVTAARQGLERCITKYNQIRPHSLLDRMTPDEFYFENLPPQSLAA